MPDEGGHPYPQSTAVPSSSSNPRPHRHVAQQQEHHHQQQQQQPHQNEQQAPPPSQPPPQPPQHPEHLLRQVRPTESRFSLREQFAATRPEYKFDDDSSSLVDRLTVAASGIGAWAASDKNAIEKTEEDSDYEGAAKEAAKDVKNSAADYGLGEEPGALYDFMCLPPGGEGVSPAMVRAAYFRLLPLLRPSSYPEDLGDVVIQSSGQLQRAFEILIDPVRRAEYDADPRAVALCERDIYQHVLRPPTMAMSSDMWLRLDASEWPDPKPSGREPDRPARSGWKRGLIAVTVPSSCEVSATRLPRKSGLEGALCSIKDRLPVARPLDFALSQSFTLGVPILDSKPWRSLSCCSVKNLMKMISAQSKVDKVDDASTVSVQPEGVNAQKMEQMAKGTWEVRFGVPQLTVAGAIYGRLDGGRDMPSASTGRYQPLAPFGVVPVGSASRLMMTKLSQPILHRGGPSRPWSFTLLSISMTPLTPGRMVDIHVGHQIPFARPVFLEASIDDTSGYGAGAPTSNMALGGRVDIGDNLGAAYFRLDGGGELVQRIKTKALSLEALKGGILPRLEVGFETGPMFSPFLTTAAAPTKGMHALNNTINCRDGSWTVAASGSPSELGATVRFAYDFDFAYALFSPRFEMETCGSSRAAHQHVAVRALWPVGRYARFGIELSTTPMGSHASLYWSRLSQRLSLPILVTSISAANADGGAWAATVAPAVAVVGLTVLASLWSAVGRSRRRRHRRRRAMRARRIQDLVDSDSLAGHVAQSRAYADDVAVIMMPTVEASQNRFGRRGGLVIHSAKLGIRDTVQQAWDRTVVFAATEEVADVTIAVAALVGSDDAHPLGRIFIPRGVRWGGIPGFWDPAPHAGSKQVNGAKMLAVRYSMGERGEIRVAVFSEGDEVILPLDQD